jgi:hypothetical protein
VHVGRIRTSVSPGLCRQDPSPEISFEYLITYEGLWKLVPRRSRECMPEGLYFFAVQATLHRHDSNVWLKGKPRYVFNQPVIRIELMQSTPQTHRFRNAHPLSTTVSHKAQRSCRPITPLQVRDGDTFESKACEARKAAQISER